MIGDFIKNYIIGTCLDLQRKMDEGFIQLKWNTHQLAFLNTLSTLRDKQVYTDVTLSCGDQFYPAHRLVLSACSTFFARTLEVASCRSPVLLLHGIDQATLEQLLMFMYDGQVTISRNDLAKLVKAAQWLGVKGLDATQDRHRANDTASEHLDSSQILESWKHYLSSFSNTNIQPESLENGIKLFKNITSMLQRDEDSCDQSSQSESQLSEEQSNQETNTQDVIPDTNIRINSVDGSVHDHFMDSCSPAQHSEDSNSSHSFKGWRDSEICQKYNLKDIIVNHNVAVETNGIFSSSPDDSTEASASKENSSADENKRSLKCKHCRRSFKIRKDLARHLRTHHDHTLNYCFSCHSKFINKKEFQSHLKIHKAKKLHTCSMCEFVSHSLYGLKKHRAVHQSTASESNVLVPKVELVVESKQNSKDPLSTSPRSERPTCPICMMVFRNKFLLKKHEDKGCKGIFRSEKGYHCPLCMYVGSRLRSVEDHLAGHTGVYRFRCSYCPYQCVRNNILKEHMSKRHPEFI